MTVLCGLAAGAQDEIMPMDPNEMYADTQKAIDAFTKKMNQELKLADWQQFKMDSLLNVNFFGKTNELLDMNMRKVSAINLYQMISDKWDEKTYESIHLILNDEQWEKYLKLGAAKEKRQRDKRAKK